jgi:uncharacterized membrane protein
MSDSPETGRPGAHSSVYVFAPIQRETNGLAIASMVLGILWVWWIGSVFALVLGLIALSQIEASQGRQTGRGMAIAGIVLGLVGVATLLLLLGGVGFVFG